MSVYDVMSGKINQKAVDTPFKIMEGAQKLTDITRLSMGSLSVLLDMPNHMMHIAALTPNVGSMFNMQAKMISNIIGGFKGTTNKAILLKEAGIHLENVHHSLIQESYGGRNFEDKSKDAIDRWHRKFMDLTLMQKVANAEKEGSMLTHMTILASYADTPFSQLHRGFREQMERYNIHVEDWALLKKAVTPLGNGSNGITHTGINNLDSSHFPNMSQVKIGEQKQKLQNLLTSYLTGLGQIGAIEPGAGTNHWVASLDANTFGGQLARYVWKYKGFAVEQYKSIGEAYQRGGYKPVVGFIGTSTMLGYSIGQLKAALAGEELQWPIDMEKEGYDRYKVLIESVFRGGSMGLIGDFVNASSKGIFSSAVNNISPTFSMYSNLLKTGVETAQQMAKPDGHPVKRLLSGMERDLPLAQLASIPINIVPVTFMIKKIQQDLYTFFHTELNTGAKRPPYSYVTKKLLGEK